MRQKSGDRNETKERGERRKEKGKMREERGDMRNHLQEKLSMPLSCFQLQWPNLNFYPAIKGRFKL